MNLLPKRLLLIGAAPLAIAAVYGGSVAFAQSGEPTPSTGDGSTPTAPAPTSPTDPTTPPHTRGSSADCPNMGGSGSGSDTTDPSGGTSTQTRFHAGRAMAPNAYAQ